MLIELLLFVRMINVIYFARVSCHRGRFHILFISFQNGTIDCQLIFAKINGIYSFLHKF